MQEHARDIAACQDKNLRESLAAGVGYHNGQLAAADRRLVESLFVKRALFCLFATSTLAVGANLPAYLVIIKSTIQYRRVAGVAGWTGAGPLALTAPARRVAHTRRILLTSVCLFTEYDISSIQQMAGRAGRYGGDLCAAVHECWSVGVHSTAPVFLARSLLVENLGWVVVKRCADSASMRAGQGSTAKER